MVQELKEPAELQQVSMRAKKASGSRLGVMGLGETVGLGVMTGLGMTGLGMTGLGLSMTLPSTCLQREPPPEVVPSGPWSML